MTVVGVVPHVVEEVVDVRKDVSLGKMLSASVMKSVVARERSPKTLSPFSRTGLEVARFRRPTVPTGGARRRPGWRRLEQRRKALERGGGA